MKTQSFHNISETKITRGCVSDLTGDEKMKCIANDYTCKTCARDGCNKKTSFAECLATDGAVSIEHKPKSPSANEKIFTKICKDYNDACFILTNDSNLVTRDCFNEYLEKTGISPNYLFENYKSSSYEMCSEPLCNDHDIKEIHCVSCNSLVDKNCVNGTSIGRKRCELEVNPSGCYHLVDEHVERGCISDLTLDKREMCESNSDECKKCIHNECNLKASFQTCIKSVPGIDLSISATCKRYDDECYIHVYNNTIRRGCVGDLIDVPIEGIDIENDCKNDVICELCSDSNDCNNREIQTENCLVCSSDDDVFCSSNPSIEMSGTCPLALKPIGCYLKTNIGLYAKRGCVLHLDEQERQNCQSSTCKTCYGINCNLKRYFQTCANCNSEVDGEKCIESAHIANEMLCPNYLGECYTLIKDGHVIRNCTGDEVIPLADTCTRNPDNCKLCSHKGICNSERVKILSCASCDSSLDASCATNDTFNAFETCQLSIHPQTCYHLIDSLGIHKRGNFSSICSILCCFFFFC